MLPEPCHISSLGCADLCRYIFTWFYLVLPDLTHLICIDFAMQELRAGTESMKTRLDQLEQSAPEVSQSRPASHSSDLSQGL